MNVKEFKLFEILHNLDDHPIDDLHLKMELDTEIRSVFNVSLHVFGKRPRTDIQYFVKYINSLFERGYINFYIKDYSIDGRGILPKVHFKCIHKPGIKKWLTKDGELLRLKLLSQFNNSNIKKIIMNHGNENKVTKYLTMVQVTYLC